jgi:GxxExxY protein
MSHREPDGELDAWARRVIQAAAIVHTSLGPGFLEAVYEEALCVELERAGIPFRRQLQVPIEYRGRVIGQARLDLVVADRLIIELKALEALAPIHRLQVLSYLRATGLELALLINFNVPSILRGVVRIVNTRPDPLAESALDPLKRVL